MIQQTAREKRASDYLNTQQFTDHVGCPRLLLETLTALSGTVRTVIGTSKLYDPPARARVRAALATADRVDDLPAEAMADLRRLWDDFASGVDRLADRHPAPDGDE